MRLNGFFVGRRHGSFHFSEKSHCLDSFFVLGSHPQEVLVISWIPTAALYASEPLDFVLYLLDLHLDLFSFVYLFITTIFVI